MLGRWECKEGSWTRFFFGKTVRATDKHGRLYFKYNSTRITVDLEAKLSDMLIRPNKKVDREGKEIDEGNADQGISFCSTMENNLEACQKEENLTLDQCRLLGVADFKKERQLNPIDDDPVRVA